MFRKFILPLVYAFLISIPATALVLLPKMSSMADNGIAVSKWFSGESIPVGGMDNGKLWDGAIETVQTSVLLMIFITIFLAVSIAVYGILAFRQRRLEKDDVPAPITEVKFFKGK